MKVLRIINSLNIGGAERSIETNVPVHITNGFDMDVLLLDGSRTSFMENLEKTGVNIYVTSQRMSIYNPLQIFKIIPYLGKYDVVHVHLFPALYWVALAKLISFSRVKLVYTEHSTNNHRREISAFKLIDEFIYGFYSVIIAISDASNENLRKYIRKGQIITIDNGINLKPFRNPNQAFKRENIGLANEHFILTQIASLREQKDQDTVIRALTMLPRECMLLLVGDGLRRKTLENLAEQLGVSERVLFLGNRTEIPELVNISDVVIMSSHYEGFGRAAVEGMAGNKPVIATDVVGLHDIVAGAGLLFKTGDYLALIDILLQLKNDKYFYHNIAHRCFERAELYSSDKMICGYEKVYEKVISESSRCG